MLTCNDYIFAGIIILYIFVIVYINDYDILSFFTHKTIKGPDDYHYRIQGGFNDHHVAVDYLVEANKRIVILGQHLKKKYHDQCPVKQAQIQNLLNRYQPDKLTENSPKVKNESSYTLNKGKMIAMCLRDKKTFDVHDFDTIMFVYLHELAHVATDATQHEPGFWITFKWLLGEAEECGIYKNINFKEQPVNYCGHYVDYSPYYDTKIKDLCHTKK